MKENKNLPAMSRRIPQAELESYLWGAAILLRGYIDAGDYKQFIFPLLFYKRLCDVYDEEVAEALAESGGDEEYAHFAENHRFRIPSHALWNCTHNCPANVGKAIQESLRAIETANPDRLHGVFGDAQWTALKQYEFALPPRDEQMRIAKILWAADEAAVSYQKLFYDFDRYCYHKVEEMINEPIDSKNYLLAEVLTESPESGCSTPPSPNDTGHYVLSLAALSKEGYVPGNLKPVKLSSKMLAAQLEKGDLLISRSNTIEFVGFAGIFSEDREDVSFPDTMMRLTVNKDILYPEYLELLLLSSAGRKHMMKVASGTSDSMKKINRRTLGEFQFSVPNKEKQKQILRHQN